MSRIHGKVVLFNDQGKQMNHALVNHHEAYYRYMLEAMRVSAAKNHDYASGADPLGNFRSVEAYGIPAHQGLLCRMADKIGRLKTYFSKGELAVKDEGLEDALMDLGNYCFLMLALLDDERVKKNKGTVMELDTGGVA